MTFAAKGKHHLLNLSSFLLIHKNRHDRKTSSTIHRKYKYFHSTLQSAENRKQKFHLCPLIACLFQNVTLKSLQYWGRFHSGWQLLVFIVQCFKSKQAKLILEQSIWAACIPKCQEHPWKSWRQSEYFSVSILCLSWTSSAWILILLI